MTDTPEKVAALYRRLLLQRSGEERLRRTYGLDLDPDVLAGVEARLMGLR